MLKKLLIISTSLLILTACTANPAAVNPNNGNSPSTPAQSTSNSSPSQSDTTTSAPVTTTGISPVDQVAYDGALQLSDKSYCEKISDSALKQNCLDKLNAVVVKAPIQQDCSNPTDPKVIDACKLEQQIAAQAALKEQQQQDLIKTEEQLRDTAIASLDITQCDKIQTSGLKQDCQVNIILQKAQKEKNPAICDQLDPIDPTAKVACIKGASN